MRKLTAMLMALMMLFGIGAACAEGGEEVALGGGLAGGWAAAEDATVTEELKAIFDKALEGLVGVDYTPVLLLGSQVVAGTNYAFLCKGTVVYPDAQPSWYIIYIYADLEGNDQLVNIMEFDFGAGYAYGSEE